MKKFLLKLSFVFLIIVISDFVFGSIVAALYQKAPSKQSYALTKCKDDIIILGSSRAENGIIPSIITDSTHLSCYNLAVGGQNIYYYYGILNTVLTHHTPKIVIIDLTVIDYNYTPKWNTEKISALYPLYHNVDSVKLLLNTLDNLNKYRLISRTYSYNSTFFTLLISTYLQKKHKAFEIKGFVPLNEVYSKEIGPTISENFQIDKGKLSIIKRIVSICKTNNIELVLTASPQFQLLNNNNQNIDTLGLILNSLNCIFLNHSQDTSLINSKIYFKDVAHLNRYGAEEYSKLLARKIKLINNNKTKN